VSVHEPARRPVLLAAVPTPFAADGGVAPRPFAVHVELVAAAGADGVFVAGTTGEGPLLADDEIVALTAAAVEAAPGGFTVVTHVGRPGTAATLALARRAVAAGAGAVAAVVPYYYALDQEQVVRHYDALGSAGLGVPAFAYTIPKRAANEIRPDVVPRLAAAGIAGLKDSTGSPDAHVAYVDAARALAGFRVLTGSDAQLLAAMRAGSGGGVTAVTATDPALVAQLRDAFVRSDDAAAERAQAGVTAAKAALDALGPSPGGIKRGVAAALREVGEAYPTAMRAPL
jgi:4-hydroxy-tetrahydrodipicolinate synthase